MTEKDISDAINIVLSALKEGPVCLVSLFTSILEENKKLRKHNASHCQSDISIKRNVLLERENLKKSSETLLKSNSDQERSDRNCQNVPKRESHIQRQAQSKLNCFGDYALEEEKSTSILLSSEEAPHPILGCACDVCQKLALISKTKMYRLCARYEMILPPNCVVLLKGDILATVSYIGHRRENIAIIDDHFLKKRRPLGITTYVWKLDNEEFFFSLKDIKAVFSPAQGSLLAQNSFSKAKLPVHTFFSNRTRYPKACCEQRSCPPYTSLTNIDSSVHKVTDEFNQREHCNCYTNTPFSQRRVSAPGYLPAYQDRCSLIEHSNILGSGLNSSLKSSDYGYYSCSCSWSEVNPLHNRYGNYYKDHLRHC